jgi:hypothetical protein
MPIVLNPRAEVELEAVVDGETQDSAIIPQRVCLVGASHKKAAEASVEILGAALPFHPSTVEGVVARIYMGLADTVGGSVRTRENLRFVGYFEDYDDDREERAIEFRARDLSSLLRDHKPLLKVQFEDGRTIDPTPRYSDTVRQAIRRILSVVPGWRDTSVKPPLELRETDLLDIGLGNLVEGRAKKGPITLKREWSAWEAIEHVCGLASLLVNVDLDEIVVRRPVDAFGGDSAVAYEFVFGGKEGTVRGPRFHKKFIRNRKGIRLVAWNPETRQRLEALYPSDNVMRTQFARRRPPPPKATKHRTAKTRQPLPDPQRDVIYIGEGAFSQRYLDDLAQKIWLEKAHQEIDGTFSTPIWNHQILSLKNGDRIRVRLRPDIDDEVRRIGDDDRAAKFLQDKYGCERAAADALVRATKRPFDDIYYLSVPSYEWPSEKLASFKFINLVKVAG